MGAPRLVIASIVLSLCVAGVWAEEAVIEDAVAAHPKASQSATMQDTEKLRSQISDLEASVADGRRELKNKDDHISELDKIILEKSAAIAALNEQIESLQRKDALDVEESVRKENSRAANLETQVENIRNQLESECKRRASSEVQAGEAEKKVQELRLKVAKLEKANDEKNHIIRNAEQANQAAERELMKTQLEVTQKMKELEEVHGTWLPPWLATHISYYLDLAETRWKSHAEPTFHVVLQKASKKSAPVQKWLEPHREAAKTKWVPAVKKRWMILSTTAEQFVQKTFTAIVKVYALTKTIILQKVAGPYFQVVKKFSKPYINRVTSVTKPYVEKARVAFKPVTPWVAPAYKKLIVSTKTYHHQIKTVVEEHLEKYEPTNSLAVKELAWFTASAILATIIWIVYRLLSSILRVKKKTPAKNEQQLDCK